MRVAWLSLWIDCEGSVVVLQLQNRGFDPRLIQGLKVCVNQADSVFHPERVCVSV